MEAFSWLPSIEAPEAGCSSRFQKQFTRTREHASLVWLDAERVGQRAMPCSTKFMLACLLAGLAGLSIAAGAAISHQAGACRIEFTNGSASRQGGRTIRGLSFVCDQLPWSHRANLFPQRVERVLQP